MSNLVTKFFKHSFFYSLSPVASQIIRLILLPLIMTVVTPSEYGLITTLIVTYSFLIPFFSSGIDSSILRFYNKKDENSLFTNAVILKVILSIPFFFILYYFSNTIVKYFFTGEENYLFLFQITTVAAFIESQVMIRFTIIRAQENPKIIALVNFISTVLSTIILVYFLFIVKIGFSALVYETLILSIFKLLLYILFLKMKFSFKLFNKNFAIKLLKYGLPTIPHKLQVKGLELVLISFINSNYSVSITGFYGLAKKIIAPLNMLIEQGNKALVPIKINMLKENKNYDLRKLLIIIIIMLIFASSIYFFILKFIFPFLFNSNFNEAIYYVPFIITVSFFQGIYYIMNTGFEISEKQYLLPIFTFISASITLIIFILSKNLIEVEYLMLLYAVFFAIQSLIIRIEANKYFKLL
ncbi:oligosaccharide flippase family protein [Flavobacteriaceae bacterium]|nr:oligosaccharide flippase family protein [Flavobacteriaceae bacterium]